MKISTILLPVRGGKVTLAPKLRGFGKGYLNGYGGKKIPEDQTIEDAVARETFEEGGVEIDPKHLDKVAVIEFYEEEDPIFECHIFFLVNWEGEFVATEEMGVPEEFELSSIPYDRMWDADRAWMPLVCSGKRIRATSRYSKGMDRQISFDYTEL